MDAKIQAGGQPVPRREPSRNAHRPHSIHRPDARPRFLRNLNSRQNRALLASCALLAGVLLMPPWLHEYRSEAGEKWLMFVGFRPLFLPPSTTATFQLHSTHVDYVMLSVEVLGVAALAVGGVRSMSDRRR